MPELYGRKQKNMVSPCLGSDEKASRPEVVNVRVWQIIWGSIRQPCPIWPSVANCQDSGWEWLALPSIRI